MAKIGKFEKKDNEFHGNIVCLCVQHNDVRLLPVESPAPGGRGPSHRVYAGEAELGAAWRKTNDRGHTFYALKLDDPSFAAPIHPNLVRDENLEWTLIWQRGSNLK